MISSKEKWNPPVFSVADEEGFESCCGCIVLPCFPDKSKRPESGGSWRQKGIKRSSHRRSGSPSATRPTLLLPPMECLSNRTDPDTTAPVLSTRVQESNRLQVPVPTAPPPSAPSPGEVFYNSEDSSDMAFIVGDEKWRFPAHSFVVGKMEQTLNALLDSVENEIHLDNHQDQPNTKPSVVLRLPSVQPNVFEQMLRYIYTHQVSLSSVESALQLLQPSHLYHLPELSSLCLSYISKHLSPSNVSKVLAYMLHPPPCIPNAEGKTRCHHDTDNQQNELVLKSFQVLDYNADLVLQSEDFETLDYDVLVEILKRDSLEVSSEAVVFDALMKWACRTCKRQGKELTAANKCAVLGDEGLFLVRYLLMTPEEFLRGPVSHGVLSKAEKEAVHARISGDNTVPQPEHWNEWKLSVKRKCKTPLSVCTTSSSERLSSITPTSPSPIGVPPNKMGTERKKKSMSKKFLNGVGDLVICVIQLLD